jgi:hypothetical protein
MYTGSRICLCFAMDAKNKEGGGGKGLGKEGKEGKGGFPPMKGSVLTAYNRQWQLGPAYGPDGGGKEGGGGGGKGPSKIGNGAEPDEANG